MNVFVGISRVWARALLGGCRQHQTTVLQDERFGHEGRCYTSLKMMDIDTNYYIACYIYKRFNIVNTL